MLPGFAIVDRDHALARKISHWRFVGVNTKILQPSLRDARLSFFSEPGLKNFGLRISDFGLEDLRAILNSAIRNPQSEILKARLQSPGRYAAQRLGAKVQTQGAGLRPDPFPSRTSFAEKRVNCS